MAEFKLGRLRFVWKGTWAPSTQYVKDDIVIYGGTSYVCTSGHTANANFDVDATANRWTVMTGGLAWVDNPWAPSTTYRLNDVVKYGGNLYICKENHVSDSTTNGGFYEDFDNSLWDLIVPGYDWKGTWQPSVYYKENDLVKYNGRTYVCLTAHSSTAGSYAGESIVDIIVSSASLGTGYTNGYAVTISAPDLPGGTQATATIVTGVGGAISDINVTNPGSGYTSVPTTTLAVGSGGTGAILTALITDSFINGLEQDQSKWQVFSDGFAYRGEWNGDADPLNRISTSYAVNDIVKFGGSLYICVVPHTSNATAFEESKWETFTSGLEYQSSWSSVTEYQIGDVVSYGGYVYVAKQRHTAEIPPLAPAYWSLLTQGFNNRERYNPLQSYKVGDVVQYGGNVYQAAAEVIAEESPWSAPQHWEKLIDGFRWTGEWTDTPAEDTYKVGDIVKYLASTYIVTAEHVPSDEGEEVDVTDTSSSGNVITVDTGFDTDKLNPNQAITFTGTGFGGLTNGVTYYVKAIISSTEFTISETEGGSTKVLTTASGTMTGAFNSRPDNDTGTFFDSFAEGDANNVLIRRGDLVTRNAIQNVRLPKGQSGTFLKAGDQDLEWDLVGQITRVYYVSLDGSDSNDGTTLNSAWRTIKYACNFVMNSGLNTRATPVVINVKTGVYQEIFPISLPKYVSLVGDELRMSIVEPTPETSGNDKFYMRDSTTMRNFTFRGATGANLQNGTTDTYTPANQYGTQRPTGGAWVSLDPGTGPNDENVWVGERSPYMQNITLFGDYCVGQKIDGALHNGGNKSLTSNDFTTILSNGVGAWCTNQGRAELVSVFTYYSYIGYLCEAGGVIRATNGNNSYGTYGSVSEGVDPTEISRTSNVDNRRLEAIVNRVQTDGADKILYVEYDNAGQSYTTATYGFEGSGILSSVVTTAQPVNGGVCEVQALTSGENYTSVTNNAQAGTSIDIRLGAADIALTNAYVGARIILIDGAGAGQYAYITSFDGGSKLCTLGMETFTPLTITATTTSTNRLTVANTATLAVDMPFTLTGTAFGGLATATQYYVKAIASGTEFTAYTDTATKTAITLTTSTGTMTLHKSGWDTIIAGITENISGATTANPVVISTTVPHAIYTGMEVTITGVTGMTQLNGNTYYASKTGSSAFALYTDPELLTPLDGTGFGTYITGGTITGKQPVLEFLNTTSRYVIEPRVVVSTGSGASATAVQTQGIDTISVSSGGKGFTIPPEVIINGDGTATGGTGAQATTTILGSLEEVITVTRGTGYSTAPTLTFVGGGLPNGDSRHATATASVSQTIKTVVVNAGGSGYTTPPSVTVTGTGGSGAIISAQISNVVGSISFSDNGTSYTSPPTVSFVGGEPLEFAEGVAVLSAEVASITVQEGGAGYAPGSTTVTLIGSSVITATAQAVIDFGAYQAGVTPGVITGITVLTNGSGYSTPPVVSISGVGSAASATANISGSVNSITITNPGRGYQTTPTISFAGGGGSGADATAVLTGSVISLTVVDGGKGWTSTPTLGFTGGGGIGADADVTDMDTVLDTVTITDPGSDYTSNPAISVTGGGGSGIILRSRINGEVQTVTVTDPGGSFLTTPLITFANGNQFKTVVAGQRYYKNASALIAIEEQQPQTLAGMDRLRTVAKAVAQNLAPAQLYQTAISRTSGTAGPSGIDDAVDAWITGVYYTIQNGRNYINGPTLLESNREFLRAEAMAYWTSFYPGTATAVWSRDVGLLIDAVVSDLSGTGVGYTTLASIKSIFLGTARTTNLATAVDGIEHIRDLALDIVQNIVIENLLTGLTITNTTSSTNVLTTSDTSGLDEGDRIIFIGSTFGGISENTTYYVKQVVNGTTFTVSTTLDGSVVALTTASGSMTLSKQFIEDTLTIENGILTAVPNLFNYARDVISTTMANSSTFNSVANLINSNKNFIRAEVIAYINTVYDDFDYDQVLCARDVGYIVDALVYDLKNGVDVNPTVTLTTTGVVSSITVNNGGTGYGAGTTVTLSGGSPTSTATAQIIYNDQTGVITGFRMTNKGKGYSSAPSVIITPDTGSGAFLRARIVGGAVDRVTVIYPGSGYSAGPNISLVDANNTTEATFRVRVANGVLSQPRFTSRGTGYTTADALVDGDGFADIAQVGQFVYVDNLTNIPTPGANIQFGDDPSAFYKLVTVREIQGPAGVIGARLLVTDNKEFIQYEIISYLNNFTYDAVKCARDVEITIEAMSDDFTYGGNARLLAVLHQYQRGIYTLFDQQRIQTSYGLLTLKEEINTLISESNPLSPSAFANKIDFLIEWIENEERNQAIPALSMPNGNFDVEDDRAKTIILANSAYIVSQVKNWMLNNSKIVGFNQPIMEREIRQILRSVAYDLTYTGNSQCYEFASSFFVDGNLTIPGVPGTSAAAKAEFLDMVNYMDGLLGDIVQNLNVVEEPGNTLTQNTSLPPGDFPGSTSRITTLITVINDIIDAGIVGSGVTKTASNFTGFSTTTRTAVLAAKTTLSGAVTDYIDDTFVNFTYDQDVCFRDTGLIVQALADDIFGDVAKSVEAGQRYYAATAALVLSDQRPQTLAAIAQIDYLIQKVIRNETYTRTQTNAFQVRYPTITGGSEASEQLADTAYIVRDILENGEVYNDVKQLLLDNKEFIKAEVVAFVSASYENLDYNIELCARDVGLIIDAITYDIYGGLSRSREAGLRYYQSASALLAITGEQYGATISAMNYLEDIIQAILNDQDPEITFQEAESRISDPSIVYDVDRLMIDDKVTLCINTIIGVINNGPSSLPEGRYSARLQISPPLTIETAPEHNTSMVIRSRYSQVRLTGHDFLNIGTGSKNDTNYPGIPLNAPNANQELVEQGGGRVFYTSTDQDGNFRVGELFKVEQSTGIATLNADAFNLSGLNELTLGGVNLGGTGATINEFSTDGTFFANSDRIVPTQKAIKTYIQSALGSGGGNIAVNAVTAGDVFITGTEIDTVGGAQLSMISDDGISITSTIASTGSNIGALTVAGGVGIVGDLNVGLSANVAGNLTVSGTGYIKVASGTTAERPVSPTAGMVRFNTTTQAFEIFLGSQWADVGGGGRPWVAKTSSYTAVNNDRILANTSATAFTISLPASPSIGDTVRIIDAAGTFDINNLTIGRNGQLIMGDVEDMVVSTKNAGFHLVYYNSTYGWRLGEA